MDLNKEFRTYDEYYQPNDNTLKQYIDKYETLVIEANEYEEKIKKIEKENYELVKRINELELKNKELNRKNIILENDNKLLSNKNSEYKKEVSDLTVRMEALKANDFVHKYHLLRQKTAFPFSPVLSNEVIYKSLSNKKTE